MALSATSWSPRGELAVIDWVQQGRWLGALGRASGWWIGDWVRYGNARYGDKYVAAVEVTGYDVQSLMNMAYVASRFEVARRRTNLSFSHHAEVAGLAQDEQDLWLDRADAAALSVRSLRLGLRETRRRAALRVANAEARTRRRELAAGPTDRCGDLAEPVSATSPPAVRGAPRSRHGPAIVCPHCGGRVDPTAAHQWTARGGAKP